MSRAMTRGPLKISVQRAVAAPQLPKAAVVRRWVAAAAAPDAAGEIALRFIGEAESAALNQRYRGREGATNVLAFPSDDAEAFGGLDRAGGDAEPPHGEVAPIGDLAICVPVVEREAAEQGKRFDAHLAHIVVHGTLHLFGYDHEHDAEAAAMEAREREVLAQFGVADPYAAEARDAQRA